jgi:hypothetical protein
MIHHVFCFHWLVGCREVGGVDGGDGEYLPLMSGMMMMKKKFSEVASLKSLYLFLLSLCRQASPWFFGTKSNHEGD